MKNSILFLITLTGIILSCNNESKKSSETTSQEVASKPGKNKNAASNQECYSLATERDTVFLKLERSPNGVTGNLIFKYFEKDSNHGNINGKIYGDTLIADYTFMSEGIQSIRQVIFLIKDNTATQGYGALQERDGKIVFTNPKEVDFSMGTKLQKVTCPK